MADNIEVGSIGGGDNDKMVKKALLTFKILNKVTGYLIPNAKQAFTQLKYAFTKAPILQYFDLKYYIWNKTDMSGYAIGAVLSQPILNNLGQLHLVAYYS